MSLFAQFSVHNEKALLEANRHHSIYMCAGKHDGKYLVTVGTTNFEADTSSEVSQKVGDAIAKELGLEPVTNLDFVGAWEAAESEKFNSTERHFATGFAISF